MQSNSNQILISHCNTKIHHTFPKSCTKDIRFEEVLELKLIIFIQKMYIYIYIIILGKT